MRRRLAEITHSLAMMELVKLVIIVLLLLTSVFCQEIEVDNWREGIEEVRLIKLNHICETIKICHFCNESENMSVTVRPRRFLDGKI